MTPKQKAFCDYYLQYLNATKSAEKAGYSSKSAFRIGAENLQKPEIKKYIAEKLSEIDKKRFLSLEQCLIDISEIARNKSLEIKDRLKAYELIMKRYPTESFDQDNKLEIIIKKASDIKENEK